MANDPQSSWPGDRGGDPFARAADGRADPFAPTPFPGGRGSDPFGRNPQPGDGPRQPAPAQPAAAPVDTPGYPQPQQWETEQPPAAGQWNAQQTTAPAPDQWAAPQPRGFWGGLYDVVSVIGSFLWLIVSVVSCSSEL